MEETTFELRELKSQDIFPMFGILNKIGFRKLKDSLSKETINDIVKSMKSDGQEDEDNQEGNVQVDMTTAIGFSIIMEVAGVILENLPSCEKEIYKFLAGLSGMSEKEIANLPMVTFGEMIVAVIKKDEFKDFFKVVSKLFN